MSAAVKLQSLRKRLIKETFIYLGLFVFEIGSAYFLLTLRDSYIEEGGTLTGQMAALSGQTHSLQDQYVKAQKSMPVYLEISKKRDSAGLSLDRQKVKDTIDKLKNTHYMPSVRLSVSPVVDSKDSRMVRKTAQMIASEVGIRFEAVSDEELFAFIQGLPRELPGALRMTKLSFNRTNAVSDDLLLAITQKGAMSMLSGDLQFVWMGIRTVSVDKPGDDRNPKTKKGP